MPGRWRAGHISIKQQDYVFVINIMVPELARLYCGQFPGDSLGN